MRSQMQGSLLATLLVVSVVAATGVAAPAVAASEQGAAEVQCSFPFSKTDATGTTVELQQAPQEVVTLLPSAAQTMWEIGAKDKVVGVTKYADYLEGSSAKTNISGSGFTTVVIEKVVALQPDLVLAPNATRKKTIEALRDKGLKVYHFRESESLKDIVKKTKLTGKLVGECEGAEKTAAEMNDQIATINEAVKGEKRPRVLYEFSGGFTAGKGTFIHTMIRTAGAKNVAALAGISGYQQISSETVVNQDPQFLIQSTRSPEPPKTAAYNKTTAVQQGNIVVINVDYLNQPAPRTIDAVRKMVKAFHPEAYQEALATPTPTPTETAGATATATETTGAVGTTTGTSTTTSSPGLGVATALVALLAAGILATRR